MRSVVEVLVSQIKARKPLFLSSKVAVACGARDSLSLVVAPPMAVFPS